jgi:hypothetical protein
LGRLGVRRAVAAGEYLYREGDASYDFYVVLSGAVVIFVKSEGRERIIARHDAGRFLGELNLLTGQRVYVSARVAVPGEVIVVSRDALRRLIATDANLSDKILAAFLARRAILMSGAATAIRVIGSRFSLESGSAAPTARRRSAATALFSFIGADSSSPWLSGFAALDDRGFVLTDLSLGRKDVDARWDALGRSPLPFETSHPGLFAVGDVRSGSTKRVAAAVGEGSAAVRSVHAYLTFDRHA